ncbi:uncharacterized protein BYT42DRAFT_578258 [Radiomyces spectabilis]|uniref:uncharacterized protein n=1 Tax=Radiomyces spectabilis TaxID=64574 RepID=UPI00221F91F9|nr:uncharacterized protein BYT42DRAFT_578258 [Radiomyces spectabilis]KAI8372864.1 hypothetical protein BYT42DRAFT_578258 [Radiomyces spectabilis]
MTDVKPKRFSFAGLTSLSRSFSFSSATKPTAAPMPSQAQAPASTPSSTTSPSSADELRQSRRAQKSQSLYIKSFRKKEDKAPSQYDAKEAVQANGKEIRNNIRRSLSAVLYASPHSHSQSSTTSAALVPVLVTADMCDASGGMIIDEPKEETPKPALKKKHVEYDNTLAVMKEKDGSLTIVWQGYGYSLEKNHADLSEMSLNERFENDVWTDYRGLIHPMLLFADMDESVWTGLTVSELRRYFDNYGSMMLKIRQTRMLQQQQQYQVLQREGQAQNEWIIPTHCDHPPLVSAASS